MIKTGSIPFVLSDFPLFEVPVMVVGIIKEEGYAVVASLNKEVASFFSAKGADLALLIERALCAF